jgi:hypothetical protein
MLIAFHVVVQQHGCIWRQNLLMGAGVGLGVMTGDVRKVLNRIMSISQDHYPETMFQTIIINAPASFRMVWSIVKGMLQPRTVNKITLLGSKYLDDLTQRVELKHLPTYLGGECAATLLEDPGPWNDETIMTNLRGIREMPSFNGASALPPASAELGRYSSVESDKDGADDFKMAENVRTQHTLHCSACLCV